MTRSLVINVPSPYLVVPPTANMYFTAAGEEKLAAHYHRIERM
jgi:hypothetical protein